MGKKMHGKQCAIQCKVKEFRMATGWSQEELAAKLDIRRQAVYDIESGRYLPNTAIALRLARLFGCRVEDLFVDPDPPGPEPVYIIDGEYTASSRLALGRVRDRLVGLPLMGPESIPFGLRSADGVVSPDKKSACLFAAPNQVNRSIILMGCDPALDILACHVNRRAPESRVHCHFASSHRALDKLAEGVTHLAGTHLHNEGNEESNVVVARQKLAGVSCYILGFSIMEEGLMVARGNPLRIRSVIDLARPMVRFVNREPGAALRVLLDTHLKRAGIKGVNITGYEIEVRSHREGAGRVACGATDAALGLRIIAEVFDLDFVPIAAVRCDLVVPKDVTDHPTVKVLLDVLQSAYLRQEIDAIPGYESGSTGVTIAEVRV